MSTEQWSFPPVDIGQCDGCADDELPRECVYVDGFGWEWLCPQCAGNGDA